MDGPIIEVAQTGCRALYVVVHDVLEMGRECDGLLLSDPEVSRRHARFSTSGGALIVEDLGSTNGTTLNGTRVHGPAEVRVGSTVRLGTTDVRLSASTGPVGARPTGAAGAGARGTMTSGTSPGRTPELSSPPTGTMAPPGGVVMPAQGGNVDARMTSIEAVAESVDTSRAGLADIRGDGDTVTIVFSDIESSTERAMKLGDERWFDVLGVHNRIVRENLDAYGGTEIKSQGDGFMLTFPSARKAVQFCISVQQELDAYQRKNPEEGVRIRIGLHTGEAIVDDDGDLFGKHIIVAARIANLADGGQILASSVVQEITSSRGDIDFGDAEVVELKGIDGEHRVHNVLWQG